jgi:hypothetical protein
MAAAVATNSTTGMPFSFMRIRTYSYLGGTIGATVSTTALTAVGVKK